MQIIKAIRRTSAIPQVRETGLARQDPEVRVVGFEVSGPAQQVVQKEEASAICSNPKDLKSTPNTRSRTRSVLCAVLPY